MVLDAHNKKISNPELVGKDIQGVASKQVRLYGEYEVPESNWAISGGVQYTGDRPIDANNDWYVDSITLLDLGARYEMDFNQSSMVVRLNIENLSDEAYWLTTSGSSNLQQGTPRTFKLSAQLDF